MQWCRPPIMRWRQSPMRSCQHSIWSRQQSICSCQHPVWSCQQSVWLCQQSVWLCQQSVWLCQQPVWLCQHPVWLCQHPVWLCQHPVWLCQHPVWSCQHPVWSCQHPIWCGQVSDVSALIHGVLTSGAGVVVPLTQQQFDLVSVLIGSRRQRVDSRRAHLGRWCGRPAHGAAVRHLLLLGGHRRDGPSSGRRHPDLYSVPFRRRSRCWAGRPRTHRRRRYGGLFWRLPLSRAGRWPATRTGVAPLGETAASIWAAMTEVGRAASLPRMAPVSNDGAIPMDVPSFLGPAHSRIPAIWVSGARAAGVASGVGGLALVPPGVHPAWRRGRYRCRGRRACDRYPAGVRVGQRQAKATFALRPMGIAAFARPGAVPLGVVRSGSIVSFVRGHSAVPFGGVLWWRPSR